MYDVYVVGVNTVYGQHCEWATLGFIRAVASNEAISGCLIDKRWLHTLLTMINSPAAGPQSADDEDNDGCNNADRVHRLSLPKRVIYLLIDEIFLLCWILCKYSICFN